MTFSDELVEVMKEELDATYDYGYQKGVQSGGGSSVPTTPTDNRTTMAYWYQYLCDSVEVDVDYENWTWSFANPIEELEWPKGTQNISNFDNILNMYFVNPTSGMVETIGIPALKMVGELDCSSTNSFTTIRAALNRYIRDYGKFINTGHITSFSNAFSRDEVLEIIPEIDTSGGTTFYRMCMLCTALKSGKLLIPNNANAKQCFYECSSLTDLELTVGEGVDFTEAFKNCTALINLKIIGVLSKTGFNVQYSPNLSRTSIESVMAAVSPTVAITVTFSEMAVNKAFATATGGTDGSMSDEWAALVATRPKCTIALK